MRDAIRVLAPLVAALLVATACNAPRAASTPTPSATGTPNFAGKTLNIVTGGTGAVYIVYGAGLAVNGRGSFAPPEKKADAKVLAVLYSNLTHLVVKDGSGINTVNDLRGKDVSVGSPGSGTEIIANRTLEAYGLDPAKDINRQRLGAADSADKLRDNKIQAFFFSGGLPVPAVSELSTGTKLKMLDLSDSISKMSAKYGNFYFPITIPKSTYNTDADVTVSGVANLLVLPSTFDPAFAQAILATMFDNKADLVNVHNAAKQLTLETATVGSPIDFHQGAVDFYKLKGVWKN